MTAAAHTSKPLGEVADVSKHPRTGQTVLTLSGGRVITLEKGSSLALKLGPSPMLTVNPGTLGAFSLALTPELAQAFTASFPLAQRLSEGRGRPV